MVGVVAAVAVMPVELFAGASVCLRQRQGLLVNLSSEEPGQPGLMPENGNLGWAVLENLAATPLPGRQVRYHQLLPLQIPVAERSLLCLRCVSSVSLFALEVDRLALPSFASRRHLQRFPSKNSFYPNLPVVGNSS
jgi:hypothetical protein